MTWIEREEEAAYLKTGGYRSMAVALRCYALEIQIKAIICQRLKLEFLPNVCKTHDLSMLIIFTGLWADLNEPTNTPIQKNWDLLVEFSKRRLNNLRYRTKSDLADLEADKIDSALDHNQYGILPWLSKPH